MFKFDNCSATLNIGKSEQYFVDYYLKMDQLCDLIMNKIKNIENDL